METTDKQVARDALRDAAHELRGRATNCRANQQAVERMAVLDEAERARRIEHWSEQAEAWDRAADQVDRVATEINESVEV